jgi:hypothetical protein
MSKKKKNEKFTDNSSSFDSIKTKEDKEFEELLCIAIESNPTQLDNYFHRAITRVSLNNIEGAVEDFIKIIETDPYRCDNKFNYINGYNLDYQSMIASGHNFKIKEKKSINKLKLAIKFLINFNLIIVEIKKIDEEEFVNKYDLPTQIDFLYWYSIINQRVNTGNTFEKIRPNQTVDNYIGEQIYGHANEYYNTYYDDDIDYIVTCIKIRIIGFGVLNDIIISVLDKLEKLALKNKTVNPYRFEINSKLIHAKASLYGIVKFALSKGVTAELIKEWYDNFIYDEDLIEGIDPFDNIENRIY